VVDGDALDPQRAERRQQVAADDRAVVAERRGLALAVVLEPSQVLLAGVPERGRPARAGQRAELGLAQHLVKPHLRGDLRVQARRRPAAPGPGGADPALDLAPAGQAILRIPGIAARARAQEHEAGRPAAVHAKVFGGEGGDVGGRRHGAASGGHGLLLRAGSRPITLRGGGIALVRIITRYQLGTKSPCWRVGAVLKEPKSAVLQGFRDAGGGTRTPDTRIMIPLL
jgi:hypothetical protein